MVEQRAKVTRNLSAPWSAGLEHGGLKFLHELYSPLQHPIYGGGMQLLCGHRTFQISAEYCHQMKRWDGRGRAADYAELFAECHPCEDAASSADAEDAIAESESSDSSESDCNPAWVDESPTY